VVHRQSRKRHKLRHAAIENGEFLALDSFDDFLRVGLQLA
jgi:hypothetical protein